MADTMMVSNVGSAAISAVSLVDSINVLVIQVFAAMGIGIGLMTVVGQCIGAGRKEEARYYIVKLTGYADDSCH
ncbi:MATE family efflux transporter [Niameybacter sp.]